jgi:predicted aspartyl protease
MPIDVHNNLMFVQVKFNDQPATMVVDTGAERTILTETAVTRLRLRRDLRHAGNTTGIGGTSASYQAALDDFALGVFALPVKTVSVGTFVLPDIGETKPDGLLGADILLAFDLDIDLPDHTLTVYRARPCTDSRPPWSFPYRTVEGVTLWRDRLMLPLTINNVVGRAILDTGAQRTVVRPDFAGRAGVSGDMLNNDPSNTMRGASREQATFRMHRFDTVRIGNELAHNVPLPVVQLPNAQEDALIGGDFLHGRRIWLSAASRQVFFTDP